MNRPVHIKENTFFSVLSRKGKIFLFLILILIIIIFISGINSLVSKKDVNKLKKEQREEGDKLIKKVSKLILLPEGIQPNILKIDNIDKLMEKSPTFFVGSKNGDIFITYPVNKDLVKGIIYSPKEDKIINVALINLYNNSPQTQKETNDKIDAIKIDTTKKTNKTEKTNKKEEKPTKKK